MHRTLLAAALALAVAVSGAALVAGSPASAARGKPVAGAAQGGPLELAAAYVGISKDALRTELRSGKSLAQVAEAHGKTRVGLVAALVAPVKTQLDSWLAAKRLTADQYAKLLALATKAVERVVDAKPPAAAPKAPTAKGGLLAAATTYLGLDRAALVAKLSAGSSLSEIAVAQGKTRAGLKAALLTAVKAKLDASTRLTADQKTAALAKASDAIERLLDLKRPS